MTVFQPAGAVTTSSLLAVCAIVEAVIAILGSAISCKVICCSAAFTAATSVSMQLHAAAISVINYFNNILFIRGCLFVDL